MALVGYARVSSVGQSLDVQLDKLKHCDKIYQEIKSGSTDQRSRLDACLEYVRLDCAKTGESYAKELMQVLKVL